MIEPRITAVRVHRYEYVVPDLGVDERGFSRVYEPGARQPLSAYITTVDTDIGVSGECRSVDGPALSRIASFAHRLLGRDPLERELIHSDVKSACSVNDRLAMGPIDCCLWDIAGKLTDTPVWRLLGGWRRRIPAYASTYHGDEAPGGLSSPEAFAEFALECRELGYAGMKIHPWTSASVGRDVAAVRATRSVIADDDFALMLDPTSGYDTFLDTLRVGRACDEAGFLWLEDPMRDGGRSLRAYRKLRQMVRTPILIGENVRSLETKIDLLTEEAADLIHCDPLYDMGITGVMKIAHACEALGLDCQLHAPGPAQRACVAAIRNTKFYEMALVHPKVRRGTPAEVYACDYADGLDAVGPDGCVPVLDGPGLGVTFDWEWLRAHGREVAVYT